MKRLVLAGLLFSAAITAQASPFKNTPHELVSKATATGDYTYLEQATTRCAGLLAITIDMSMQLQGESFDELDEVMQSLIVASLYLREFELDMPVDDISNEIFDISIAYGQEMITNMEKTGNLLGVDGKLSAEVDSCFNIAGAMSEDFVGKSI